MCRTTVLAVSNEELFTLNISNRTYKHPRRINIVNGNISVKICWIWYRELGVGNWWELEMFGNVGWKDSPKSTLTYNYTISFPLRWLLNILVFTFNSRISQKFPSLSFLPLLVVSLNNILIFLMRILFFKNFLLYARALYIIYVCFNQRAPNLNRELKTHLKHITHESIVIIWKPTQSCLHNFFAAHPRRKTRRVWDIRSSSKTRQRLFVLVLYCIVRW